jgi:hypothetical protein
MTEEEFRQAQVRGQGDYGYYRLLRHYGSPRKFRLYAVALCRIVATTDVSPDAEHFLVAAEDCADDKLSFDDRRSLAEQAYQIANELQQPPPIERPEALIAMAVANCLNEDSHATLHAEYRITNLHAQRDGLAHFHALASLRRRMVPELIGDPFVPVTFDPEWRTSTAVSLSKQMYESRDFSAMPILADALQDAGCEADAILAHCRDPRQVHVRGCWVVDLVLGKA